MKAEDLKLAELVEFGDGLVQIHGRRLVIHDIRAFAQLRKDLLDAVGLDQARCILTRFGYFWGQEDAAAMSRIFTWDSLEEWVKAGPLMHTIQGIAKAIIGDLSIDPESESFRMTVFWHSSGEAREHLMAFGKSSIPVCWMLAGYASGYASFCMNKRVYFIEKKCMAMGHKVCMAEGRDIDSWSNDIASHIPFFDKTQDMRGAILELTRKLKEKTRELARKQQLAQRLLPSGDGLIEVRSPEFKKVVDLAHHVAPYDSSVLITGESGTGKEVLAKYIHRHSARNDFPFVAINCTALPDTLLESELFGHTAGAFTGASRMRKGLFEEAERGTVFLDEIGDISPALQMKLLRVLQEREITRLGENRPRQVNVRIISATNRDISNLTRDGRFREDLYYRLCVIVINIPSLRNRREDIIPLARHFVNQRSKGLNKPNITIHGSCFKKLMEHSWPGNVRELENAMEHAVVLAEKHIRPEHLPLSVAHSDMAPCPEVNTSKSLRQVQDEHILRVLEFTHGSKSRAAAILEMSPSTMWRRLKAIRKSGQNLEWQQ